MVIDAPIHTNESNLARVLGTGLPALLVFWSRNSAPSEQLMPALDRLARLYAGRALMVKIDASEEHGLVNRYRISHLPSIVLVKGDQNQATLVGTINEQELDDWINYVISGGPRPAISSGPSITLGGASAEPASPPRQSGSTSQRTAGNGMPGAPVTLTDATFDQAIRNSRLPVMVDFWAEWCGPCRMVAPIIEQLAHEFAGRAQMGKLNVDENPSVASRYGIMSIPTLLIFRDGQIVDRVVGAQPGQVLRQLLAKHLK
jgi:thioredoxin 1